MTKGGAGRWQENTIGSQKAAKVLVSGLTQLLEGKPCWRGLGSGGRPANCRWVPSCERNVGLESDAGPEGPETERSAVPVSACGRQGTAHLSLQGKHGRSGSECLAGSSPRAHFPLHPKPAIFRA